MTAYWVELLDKLAKLNETTITPSQPCPSVVDTEKQYIRIVHDESTFYSNADQMKALKCKTLGAELTHAYMFCTDSQPCPLRNRVPIILCNGATGVGGEGVPPDM